MHISVDLRIQLLENGFRDGKVLGIAYSNLIGPIVVDVNGIVIVSYQDLFYLIGFGIRAGISPF